MVAITFHYRHVRLEHLYETVRSICHFPVGLVDFHIYTNTNDAAAIASITEILSDVGATLPTALGYERRLEVHTVQGLSDPQHLTWAHKPLIRDAFAGSSFTHFIYTEDDHELSYLNFLYFDRYRGILKAHNLLPGFTRTELNLSTMEHYSTDALSANHVEHKRSVTEDGLRFITLDNPYMGMFVLDQEMAGEYLASRSFDIELSKQVYSWEVCERSAMGLTWESASEGFWTRVAVPVSEDKRVLGMACIRHLPNTYANRPESPLGKIRMKDVIV